MRSVNAAPRPRRILVVKLASLGDLLTATPALRAIRLGDPRAHVAVLATPSSAPALGGLDSVDEVIPFDKFAFDRARNAARGVPLALRFARTLRAGRWDAVVLLHHLTTAFGVAKYAALMAASGAPVRAGLDNGRGGWFLTHRAVDRGFGWHHEADYWLEVALAAPLGARRPEDPRLEIADSPEGDRWAANQWTALGPTPSALLVPGSGAFSRARRWAPRRFAAVGRAIKRQHGFRPLVLAGLDRDEQALAREVAEMIGPPAVVVPAAPTPRALGAFLRRCEVVIANDSGPVHVAAAVGAPVVAIFGPTNHRAWGPYPPSEPRHQVVREVLACAPCIHRGHAFGTPEGCAARTCLAIVRPDDVLNAVERAVTAPPVQRREAVTAAPSPPSPARGSRRETEMVANRRPPLTGLSTS